MPLWFLAGPPVHEAIFQGTITRLGKGEAVRLFDSEQTEQGWEQCGERLSLRASEQGGVLLFAHGLAVPAAIATARKGGVRLLILSNGPITRLDPVTSALSTLSSLPGTGAFFSRLLMHPRIWLPSLSSSLGLRRTVVNPYVMDRDTVASLAGPLVATHAGRLNLLSYLRSLGKGLPSAEGLPCPVWAIWGDSDPLYPSSEADFLDTSLGGGHHISVPGGQHFHPEERPWELAENISTVIRQAGIPVGS